MGHEPYYWLLKYALWDRYVTAGGENMSIKATVEVVSIGNSITEADKQAKLRFGSYLGESRLVEAKGVGSEHPHIK